MVKKKAGAFTSLLHFLSAMDAEHTSKHIAKDRRENRSNERGGKEKTANGISNQ